MVNIITDSTADLDLELAGRNGIQIIPLYVNLGDKTYKDGCEINLPQLFEMIDTTGQMPKTSAPSIGDFISVFRQSDESIFIGISSQLSVTIQNAHLAQEACQDRGVYIIDSLNITKGISLLALKAADLRSQGLSASEIYQVISELVPKVRTSFIIETLDYLYKGGRCSAMQNLMGSLLQIRPVIAVRQDGTLGVRAKTRGTRLKALQAILDDFHENLPLMNLERVFIPHTGCEQDARYLKDELLKLAPIQEINIGYAGTVIASHCGPKTIGICYLLK
jgi:DegV family protein with EDD domain